MEKKDLRFNQELKLDYNGHEALLEINISLDDDCHNGHHDFHVTGEFSVPDLQIERFGAISDIIKKMAPEYSLLCDLHLCKWDGSPMCVVGNGVYWVKKSEMIGKKYLGLEEGEYEVLRYAIDNETMFAYALERLGVIERMRKRGEEGVRMLEELTGDKWINPYKSEPLLEPEKYHDCEIRYNAGYCTERSYEFRRQKEREKKRDELRESARLKREKRMAEIDKEYLLDLVIAEFGYDNYFYNDHGDYVTVNFLNHKEKMEDKRIEELRASMDRYNELKEVKIKDGSKED